MISKIKTLIKFFLSFISIVKLNILIFFYKLLKPKKRIIFIYHPTRSLTFNNKNYLEKLFSDYGNNYLIINGHQIDKIKERNYFFIIHNIFLKFIFGIDIFFSTYLSDGFTPNSFRIYMHHDIYDTPLVNNKKLYEFYKRIIKYNYLFLTNKQSIKMFKNLFAKFNENKIDKIPELFEIGYYKLDFLNDKKKFYQIKENQNIIIAPTNFLAWPEFCINNLEEVIATLLQETKYKIIYRPHPSNWNHPYVKNVIKKFSKFEKFNLDNSIDYFEIYLNSKCMIRDFSGTAYTYSLFTKKPVIFFSQFEKLLNNLNYAQLSYFKDREKIGFLCENLSTLINSVLNIEDDNYNKINSIEALENNFTYLSKTKDRTRNLIDDILIKIYDEKK
jgi:hypothetical protein